MFDMTGPCDVTSGALRWARGGVVGISATGLAYVGHLLAMGARTSTESLLLLMVAAVVVGVSLSGQRWTLPSLLSVLLGAQALLHYAFAGMGPSSGHGGMQMASSITAPADISAMGAMAGHPGWTMMFAHVLAALVTAILLRRGEDWCWRLVGLVARPLVAGAFWPAPVSRGSGPRPALDVAVPLFRTQLLADAQPRRGPPWVLAGF